MICLKILFVDHHLSPRECLSHRFNDKTPDTYYSIAGHGNTVASKQDLDQGQRRKAQTIAVSTGDILKSCKTSRGKAKNN